MKFLVCGITATAVTLILLGSPNSVQAKDDNGWSFNLAPYTFALALEGDVATLPSASPAEVDIRYSGCP